MSDDLINNKDGPDFVGYYKELFLKVILDIEEHSTSVKPVQLFSDCLSGGFSSHTKARLRFVLHEAAATINKEVDKLLEKVIAKLEAESDLRQLSCFSGKSNKDSTLGVSTSKKRRISSGSDSSQRANDFSSSDSVGKVYREVQSLDGNGEVHQEVVNKYSADLLQELCKMEQGTEELLNEVAVNCRVMSSSEKQQLGRRIQKLPEKAYNRLVEIFQSRNPFSRQNADSVFINLEKQDDATLWRLYFYVETVLKASKT